MASGDPHRIVAAFKDRIAADRAAERVRAMNAMPHIGGRDDQIASLRGEMHEEVSRSFIGPGNVGPFTRQQTWAVAIASIVSLALGAAIAMPLALIPIGGFPLWARLLLFGSIGAVAGWTVGFTLSGGRSLPADHQMASERGVVVSVDAPDLETAQRIADALSELDPIRVDRIDADGGIDTMSTERSIGHQREKDRRRDERHRRGA